MIFAAFSFLNNKTLRVFASYSFLSFFKPSSDTIPYKFAFNKTALLIYNV